MSIVPINQGHSQDSWDQFIDFPLPPSISSFFPGFEFGFGSSVVNTRVSVESGNFLTRFKIPDNGNLEQLKTNMRHGILLVTVPKFHQPTSNRNVRVVEIEGTD
ncbi:17.5 kDa class I heat shock protein [Glycine soja]|nr:17.5 kDa class I heat shock protein [Glycine soja]